jgi:hypothetical protein
MLAVRVVQSTVTDWTSAIENTLARNREQSSRSDSRNVASSLIRIIPLASEIELDGGEASVLVRDWDTWTS